MKLSERMRKEPQKPYFDDDYLEGLLYRWADEAAQLEAQGDYGNQMDTLEDLKAQNIALLEELERTLRHLEEHIAIGMFYETEIIRQDLREAIRKAKGA